MEVVDVAENSTHIAGSGDSLSLRPEVTLVVTKSELAEKIASF